MFDYDLSCRKAQLVGYKEVHSVKGFLGSYFIKDGKFWIHDLYLLLKKLGYRYDEELYNNLSDKFKIIYDGKIKEILEPLNYNVDDYRKYEKITLKTLIGNMLDDLSREWLITLIADRKISKLDRIYIDLEGNGIDPVILIEGVYLYPDGTCHLIEDRIKESDELLDIFSDAIWNNGMTYLSDGIYLTEDGELFDAKN
ncbi:hypothetical protein ACLSZN_08605 [Avibacterium avium]|uniref:hypothetical protein n=1 Tax=Avibacterium avium TaxID=751 RepID=UPI003BF7B267